MQTLAWAHLDTVCFSQLVRIGPSSTIWAAARECHMCQELTTLWVARLNDSAELKVTDPKEQQGDVKEEETKGECYDPEPSPQFSIIFHHLFHALGHSSLTRSFTRRSDRHQIT